MDEAGAFCRAYGNSARNRIIEYLLENEGLDFAAGDLARETNLSRPKAYEVVAALEREGYVARSRIVGRTQLYRLERDNRMVQLFRRDFRECLRIIAGQRKRGVARLRTRAVSASSG